MFRYMYMYAFLLESIANGFTPYKVDEEVIVEQRSQKQKKI